jgi:hypothetical protein
MRNPREISEETFEKVRRRNWGTPRFRVKPLPRCTGKQSYKRKDAEEVRDKLLQRGAAAFLRVYHCPKCTHWHLTHKHS